MTGKFANWRFVVRAFVALALALAAFAHRPVPVFAYGDADLSAYVLPDGTLPVLCLPGQDGEGGHDAFSGHCDFCRIASSFDMPEPPATLERGGLTILAGVLTLTSDTVATPPLRPHAPPRGPPAIAA